MELFSEIDAGQPTLTDLRAIRDRLATEVIEQFEPEEFFDLDGFKDAVEKATQFKLSAYNIWLSDCKRKPIFHRYLEACKTVHKRESAEYQKAMEAR